MPADAQREPPLQGSRYGHGRPPNGPPEGRVWAMARTIFGCPQQEAAPALPPLTASGLHALHDSEIDGGAVQRQLGGDPDITPSNGLCIPIYHYLRCMHKSQCYYVEGFSLLIFHPRWKLLRT